MNESNGFINTFIFDQNYIIDYCVQNCTTDLLYDIDLEEVSRQTLSDDFNKAPALLLSGEVQAITQQFQIDLVELKRQLKRLYQNMVKLLK